MNPTEKVIQLSSIILDTLIPLINHDYVLYGLPNYPNIGDTLIWEGELEFLKKVPYKCKGTCTWNDYPSTNIAGNSIILITGGGYFGDIWRKGWQYVLDGIRHYKDNRIIILPNSIYYNDNSVRDEDAQYLAGFKDLIICARDQYSYRIATTFFKNNVLLVPDMAFCISKSYLSKWVKSADTKALLLKRCDKELVSENIIIPEDEYDTYDWPTINNYSSQRIRFNLFISRLRKIQRKMPMLTVFLKSVERLSYYYFFRKQMTSCGVAFISSYQKIYTTRLHALILSILLDKEVFIIDNCYGKLGSTYSTWLQDVDSVHLLDQCF